MRSGTTLAGTDTRVTQEVTLVGQDHKQCSLTVPADLHHTTREGLASAVGGGTASGEDGGGGARWDWEGHEEGAVRTGRQMEALKRSEQRSESFLWSPVSVR